MRRSPRRCEAPASLSDSACQHLNMYALAATAAGVGVLALAQPAEAKIVYTPTWKQVLPQSSVDLDLNNDGTTDFRLVTTLVHKVSSSHLTFLSTLKVLPKSQGNAIWGTGKYAALLGSGVSIGPKGKLQAGHEFMAAANGKCDGTGICSYGSSGQWKQVTHGFLGLKFIIQGEIHYGWARLNITVADAGIYGAVTGFAYETVPNKPIITGKEQGPIAQGKKQSKTSPTDPGFFETSGSGPASLGALARGSLGLYVWRKREAAPIDAAVRPEEKRS
jgi:hypothetical protein